MRAGGTHPTQLALEEAKMFHLRYAGRLSLQRGRTLDHADRITFAIAVFDELGQLRAALMHLLEFGFEPQHLLLLAKEDAFSGALSDAWLRDDGLALSHAATWLDMAKTHSEKHSDSAHEISPSQSLVSEGNDFSEKVFELAVGFHSWLMPEHASALNARLESGEGALFVNLLDEGLLAESCHALLPYASGNVQTHQVKL